MFTKRIWLLIGALTILSAGAIGVGTYLLKESTPVLDIPEGENLEEPIFMEPEESTLTEPEEISPVSEIDISDWQVYRNEEYGYEIKYPLDWIIETYEEDYGKNAKKPISLALHTKDKQKIENYQESLMASINIYVINKTSDFTVEDYLRDLGYDLNSETIRDGRVLLTRGIAEVWMNIKKENFKGQKAYVIQPLDIGYYLYFEYNQNIYKITSLWHNNEISKEEILEIINTFKFINL